ncbi:MAG: carboxypeptidase-like regulatory domain-containing protein [Candidatus Anstonellales archaeon]
MMKQFLALLLVISALNALQVSADPIVASGIPSEKKMAEVVIINNKPESAYILITSSSFIKIEQRSIHLAPYEAKAIPVEITIPTFPQTGEIVFSEMVGSFEIKLVKQVKAEHSPVTYIFLILFGLALFIGSNNIRIVLLLLSLPAVYAQAIVNETVEVLNIPPIAYNVTIVPDQAYRSDTLTCFATYDDANNDAGQLEFFWFVNGVQVGTSNTEGANPLDYIQNGQTLSGAFNEGDIVNCSAIPFDFQDYGILNSTEIIILENIIISPPQDKLQMALKGHCVNTEFSIYVYSDSHPIENAHITIERETGELLLSGKTDEKGYFYFVPTEAIKMKVKAQKSGYTSAYGIIYVYNDTTCYTKPEKNDTTNETEPEPAHGYDIPVFGKTPPLILKHENGTYEGDVVTLNVSTPRRIGDLLIIDELIQVPGARVVVYWIGNETNISGTKNPLFVFEGISDTEGKVRFIGRYAYNYYGNATKIGYIPDDEYFDLLPKERSYGGDIPPPAPQQVRPDCFYILATLSLSFLGLGYLRLAEKEAIEASP